MDADAAALEFLPASCSAEPALATRLCEVRGWFEQRFGSPTLGQRLAWPAIDAGRNLLLSAPTGGGKTLAAFLPILDKLLQQPPVQSIRCLYLAPLKSLANDVRRNLHAYLAGISAFFDDPPPLPRVAVRTGDTPAEKRKQLWIDPPDILLTTPESLAVLLTHDMAAELFMGLRWLVIDEVHAFAGSKRGADLSLSGERLELLAAGSVQRIGLSATSTPLQEAARFLVGTDRPCSIACIEDPTPLELVVQPLPGGPGFLRHVIDRISPELEQPGSTLIFTNTRALAERLSWALRHRFPQWNDQIAVHHSSIAAVRRRRVERRLKSGRLKVVVSSTSLELGIDIGSVDRVILVHPPGDVVRLLQRVGRAGHAPGRPRRGLVLAASAAELLEATVTAASGRSAECEPITVPAHPLDVLCQHLLGMAATREWTADEAYDTVRQAYAYRDLCGLDFDACLAYLSGRTTSGQENWLPARIRWDGDVFRIADDGITRLLRRNLGTILAEEPCPVLLERPEPDDGFSQTQFIGHVDEAFVDRLQAGDRFLLDGLCLEFVRTERMRGAADRSAVVVTEVVGRPPAPRWTSDGWPVSAELARRLYTLHARAAEALRDGPDCFSDLLMAEYGLEGDAIAELIAYFVQQETVSEIPDAHTLLIEEVPAVGGADYYFHTPLNSKGNDAIARVLAARLVRRRGLSRPQVTTAADLGFALCLRGGCLSPDEIRVLLALDGFDDDLRRCLADSFVLRERFQRVATTGLMVLRNPVGGKRKVGGRDWAERRLFDQVRAADPAFVLLRQAEREVAEEVCDFESARAFLEELPLRTIRIRPLREPGPFVEGWTQASASVTIPPGSSEEVLRRLHARLTGTDG